MSKRLSNTELATQIKHLEDEITANEEEIQEYQKELDKLYDEQSKRRDEMIFVFGSNLMGIHGAGSALDALRSYGAEMHCGEGLRGKSYALPTKLDPSKKMSFVQLQIHVERFLQFAAEHPELNFKVTRVGCNRAGFTDGQVASLFEKASDNCFFDRKWWVFLPTKQFWGTY